MAPTAQTAPINGADIFYETHGEGAPVLLLHGFTGSGADWQPFIAGLTGEYQLIIPDLRGHGRSTNPSSQFTHRQAALDLFALLDRLGVTTFRAIGVSGGGNCLLHMATQQPRRIEAMVLVSATMYFPQSARAIMRQVSADTLSDEEWRLMRQRHVHGDAQIRALWTQANAFKDSYDDMNFTPPQLATITARTLIVNGDRDPFYPTSMSLEMSTAIPRSYLWIIPNAGHAPIFTDLRDRFTRTAAAFLRGNWTQQ